MNSHALFLICRMPNYVNCCCSQNT